MYLPSSELAERDSIPISSASSPIPFLFSFSEAPLFWRRPVYNSFKFIPLISFSHLAK